MATILFLNNYQTTLGAALSSTATTMTVSSTTGLPSSLASGQFIPMTLTPASNPGSAYEIVYVTGISGSSLTITRGQEGTSALNWNTGDILFSTNTAQTTGTSMGSPSTDFQTNTLTASGLITANDGIDVTAGAITAGGGLTIPSGETLDVAGTLTIPNATAPNQPVALGQFVGPGTTGGRITSLATSTTYTQTLSFTAPSAGYVWGQVRTAFTGESASSIDVALLINGTAYGSDSTLLPMTEAGVTSVTAGEAVTVEAQMTIGSTSPGIGASLYVDAIFIPSSSNI